MKKIVAMSLVACTLASALAGCAQSSQSTASGTTSETTEPRTELTFAFFRGMESVSPHTTASEMWFQEAVYETLVSVENSGIEPCLAESWEISVDGLTYTFNIREGVVFTDGVALDAYVIEQNFDNIWADANSLQWLESLLLTESYREVDEFTFEIVLTEPYYPTLTELGLARPYGIGSPNIFIEGEPRNVTEAIGTGPYYLAEEKTDEYVILQMNEDYWGEKPTIETVTMKVIPDNQTRIMALENGEVDLIYGVNVLDAATLKIYEDNDTFEYATSEPNLTKHLVLNATVEGLDDLAVRQAINHAVDKQAIADGVYYGMEQPADALFASNVPYCDVDLEPYGYDKDLAVQILEDAGWMMGSDGIRRLQSHHGSG